MQRRGSLFRLYSIVAVTTYLALAYLVLRLRGRLKPQFSVLRLLRNPFKRRYSARLCFIHAQDGCCFTTVVPEKLTSDREGLSKLQVYEDGYPLAFKGASHEKVRTFGRGSFCHWGCFIYFSSSDNTDPRANGRIYTVREV